MKQHPPQRASRVELQRRLGIIRSNMPTLLRLFPRRVDFLNEFESFANDVGERAEGDDSAWIADQLKQILQEYGVDEAPPDLSENTDRRSSEVALDS